MIVYEWLPIFLLLLVQLLPTGADVVALTKRRKEAERLRQEEAEAARLAQLEADRVLAKQEQARIAAIKRSREKSAAAATLQRSAVEAAKLNIYSNARDSYKHHKINQFFVKPHAAPGFCITLPEAESHNGYRNGETPISSYHMPQSFANALGISHRPRRFPCSLLGHGREPTIQLRPNVEVHSSRCALVLFSSLLLAKFSYVPVNSFDGRLEHKILP